MTGLAFNILKLRRNTFLESVEYFEQIASTNTAALDRLHSVPELDNVLVLTAEQTAGRGRGNHQWYASKGALTFSLIRNFSKLSGNDLATLALVTGIGVANGLQKLTSSPIQLKWPNDIFVAGKKLGGILIETHQATPQTPVIGIGLNINNQIQQHAPKDVAAASISLIDLIGTTSNLTDVLIGLLNHLDNFYRQLNAKTTDIPSHWNPRCMLKGSKVDFVQGKTRYQGNCHGVQADGALLLEIDGEIRPFYSGSITL
ncbi:MAG: biotin--[acetyl-CoA-carboxylase] ligase [Planctomycetaceae bacterium]|nr:biotin--[acetyl-CoA-carboxylase] ligase [Planctomycetaceae bacterium]